MGEYEIFVPFKKGYKHLIKVEQHKKSQSQKMEGKNQNMFNTSISFKVLF